MNYLLIQLLSRFYHFQLFPTHFLDYYQDYKDCLNPGLMVHFENKLFDNGFLILSDLKVHLIPTRF